MLKDPGNLEEKYQDSTNEYTEFEKEHLKLELELLKQKISQKKNYAILISVFNSGWLIFVGSVLIFHGFTSIKFYLSDTIIITLLGTTTANILALFVIVANYLFPVSK